MPDAPTFLASYAEVGLAFALGLVIGVERGWFVRREPDGASVAGIRTFARLGLAGGTAAEVSNRVSPLLGAVVLIAAVGGLLIG